jgi:hypothetical protein
LNDLLSGSIFITSESPFSGFFSYADKNSIYVKSLPENKTLKFYEGIIESEILGMKMIEFNKRLYIITISRDGKFNVIDTEQKL